MSSLPNYDIFPKVLVTSPGTQYSWVEKNEVDGVPVGAVIGGHSKESGFHYVVQARDKAVHVAGNYKAGADHVDYFKQGEYRESRDWQYLVSSEEAEGE